MLLQFFENYVFSVPKYSCFVQQIKYFKKKCIAIFLIGGKMCYFTNEGKVSARMCLLARQQRVLWSTGKLYVKACTCPLAFNPVLTFLFILVGKKNCDVHHGMFAHLSECVITDTEKRLLGTFKYLEIKMKIRNKMNRTM